MSIGLVVFKTNAFPTYSETFIVSNIVAAIDSGYEVKIIVDKKNPINNTSQLELLKQYGLMNLVSKFSSPIGRNKRILKSFFLVANLKLFLYFIKYCFLKKKLNIEYIFILNFYNRLRNASCFHVHFATARSPLLDLKKIGFLKGKIIVTFHGYDEHGLPIDRRIKDVLKDFDEHVTYITTNSNYLKTKLVKRGFNETLIKIIPIGIDTKYFSNSKDWNKSNRKINIVTIGRLVEIKGHKYGIKAIKLLLDKGYDINYTIIGVGNELESLNNLIIDLKLKKEIRILEAMSQKEIRGFLKKQDLFLMTSTSDSSGRCEAFGVVSLESQAMGVPVVGFKSGGFPETMIDKKTGVLIEDKNTGAMADAVEKLIKDENLRKEMSMNAINHIKINLDSKNITQKYIQLYS